MGESEKHYVALRKGVGGWVKVKNTTTLHYVIGIIYVMLNMVDFLKTGCYERLNEIVSTVNHNQTSKEYKCIFKNGDVS